MGIAVHVHANQLTIPKITSAPTIDAFIDGPIATDMREITGFTQRWPLDGEPPSQRTVVYLGYDDDHLHVVYLAYDDPAMIRASLAPRERIGDDDTVGIMIDAFNDKRRAYRFSANALGVQRDQFYVEGQSFDSSYDTVWQSDGRISDWGYVVTMAIPFKNLRFAPRDQQTWGIVLLRGIERLNEFNTWPHVSSAQTGYLNQAATASGIRGVSPGGNMLVIPYTTASSISGIEDGDVPEYVNDEVEAKAGVDIKRVWRDSIVTDLTINPDFSQVESDEPQVTVNQRFEVFFPERRPFFLENADVFRTPYTLLFTRRIADPEIGARVTGKTGPWAIGSFVIDDEAPGKRLPHADPNHGERAIFATARVIRDVGAQSRVGAIAVHRSFGGEDNLVAGVDGLVKWNPLWTTDFQAVHSTTSSSEAPDTDGTALTVDLRRGGRHFRYDASMGSISEDFDAQAGFVRRTGIHNARQRFRWSRWPTSGPLVKWDASLEGSGVWDEDGDRLDKFLITEFEIEFPGKTEIEISASYGRERLTVDDSPELATDRDYNSDSVGIEFETAWWKRFNFSASASVGNGINFRPLPGLEPQAADWSEASVEFSYRPTTQVSIDTSAVFTTLDDDATGDEVFDDLVSQVRLNWQFTRELSLRAIVQHERTDPNPLQTRISDRENWNYDLLLTYRVNPWTAVYLGYNTNRQNLALEEHDNMRRIVRTDDLEKDSEQLLLKVSYLFSG
jgi:hypothetical protein